MEEKERVFFEDVELVVSMVEVVKGQDEKVFKIKIDTDKGKITYKPQVEKKEYVEGMAVFSKDKATLEQIPEVIKKIALQCNVSGNCKVRATYQYWKPAENNADGKVYRYIQGKMIDKWQIISSSEEQITG